MELLKLACNNGYVFQTFDSGDCLEENIIFLRHDVDYMPEWAVELAKIEHSLGIKAVYFFQLTAPFYNLREPRFSKCVKLIRKLGQDISLHFDVHYYGTETHDDKKLCQLIKNELNLLKNITEIDHFNPYISFHNPPGEILGKGFKQFNHTYEPKFFNQKVKYLSDSNQTWHEGCVCNIFRSMKYQYIHLLIHPYCWPMEPQKNLLDVFIKMIEEKKRHLLEYATTFNPVIKQKKKQIYKKFYHNFMF